MGSDLSRSLSLRIPGVQQGPGKSNILWSCHDTEKGEDPKISPYSWSSRNWEE